MKTTTKIGIGVAALAAIGIGVAVWRKKTKDKRDQARYYSPDVQIPIPAGTINALEKAASLAHHLGTAYDWWDPRYATENDQQAYEVLLTIPESAFRAVENEYNQKYGRNLRQDLKKLLDDDLYSKIKYLS